MDSKVEQAKEWAWGVTAERIPDTSSGRAKLAAAKVIQSLPDQWVDAEKVRWILHEYAYRQTTGQQAANILNDLKSLITPSLPTLADMTPEDREACRWMQAGRVSDFEPDLPRPEDVPSGEAWLVRYKDRELVAYKADLSCVVEPWTVYLSDQEGYWWLSDADITLVSRLVPERKESA